MRNHWDRSTRQGLLTGVSVACLAGALAMTPATAASAADRYFLATSGNSTLNSGTGGRGGFDEVVGATDRAIYNQGSGTSSHGAITARTMGQLQYLAPYDGVGFTSSPFPNPGFIILNGILDGGILLGIDNRVDQQISLHDKMQIATDQEWRISSDLGSLRQLGTRATRSLNLDSYKLTLNAVNAANYFQLDNPIVGTGGLVTKGLGTTILTGANTYSGGTFLKGGVLSVSSDGNLGAGAGALSFDGGALRITGTTFASTARAITFGAGGGGFDIADPAVSFTLSQVLGGTGGLRKLGDGELILTGVNTYAGATIVETGRLALTGGASIASSGVQVDSVFDISGTTAGASIKSLSGEGSVELGAQTLSLTFAADTFDGVIEGSGGLTLSGGTQVLTGDNIYTGATMIAGGALRINGDQSAATGRTTVKTGGVLGGDGTVGGDVVVEAGGKLAPGNSPGTLTIAGDLTLDSGSVLDFEFGHSNVVGGPMNDLVKVKGDLSLDGALNVTETGGGAFGVGLYRVISYDGALGGAALALGSMPAGSNVGVQTAITGQVNLINAGAAMINFWDGSQTTNNNRPDGGTGTWRLGGTANWTNANGTVNSSFAANRFAIFAATPGVVTIDDVGGAVSADGLQFAVNGYRVQGDDLIMSGPEVIFRVGDGTGDGVNYTATIASNLMGGGTLRKTDLGTLILTGANSLTGGMNIEAGKVLVNGVNSGAPLVNTVGASGTLGGTGTIEGNVNVDGTLAPGGLSSAGKLTINGDLVLASGARLNYRLGQADAVGGALNDLIMVDGDLVLDGTLNVTASAGGTFGPGIYRLIDYTGVITDHGLAVGSTPGAATNTIQTSIGGQVNLVSSAPSPGGGGSGGGGTTTPPQPPPEFVFWDGDGGAAADGKVSGGDGVWRASSGNWTTASGAQNGAFSNPRFAIFAGTGGTVRLDASDGAIEVNGAQFAADGYRLTGDALNLAGGENIIRVGDGTTAGAQFQATLDVAVTGAGGLTKSDGGVLILTGENTYAGGTRVNGGTLRVGAGGTSGSILGDVITQGTLVFDRSDDVAFSGGISGAGAFVQAGGGTTTLIADSSAFSGRTQVLAGVLAVDGALGGLVSVHDGARLSGNGAFGDLNNLAGGVVAPGHDKGRGLGALTVRGDYYGEGGGLELQAELGGDASAADRLLVTGATHGETLVKVLRQGGQGAATQNGIRLIEVGGASDGVFTLANPDYVIEGRRALVGGAYGYVLAQDDGGWSLRSSLPAQQTPPTAPVTPSTPQVTLYQPGVPVYEALPRVLSALSGVGTLRQRTGERQWSGEAGASVWGRLDGRHLHAEPTASASLSDLDIDSWTVQFGVERHARRGAGGRSTGGRPDRALWRGLGGGRVALRRRRHRRQGLWRGRDPDLVWGPGRLPRRPGSGQLVRQRSVLGRARSSGGRGGRPGL